MADNKLEVYIHLVWATQHREAVLTGDLERSVHRLITAEAHKLRCEALAVNGMADHVHLLVRLGSNVTLGKLMNQVKGVPSSFINSRLYPNEERKFHWQRGYGAFSIGINQIGDVRSYIRNQKAHHAANKVWDDWEHIPSDDDTTVPPDNDAI